MNDKERRALFANTSGVFCINQPPVIRRDYAPCRSRPGRITNIHRSVLALSFALVLLPAAQAGAYESFSTTISAYQGIELTSGMTEFDPTVLTVIIGDALEIDAIAAPDIDPLFHFSPNIGFFFGLTTDDAAPVELTALSMTGIAVLEDTEFSGLTDSLLDSLEFTERTASVDSNDLVALLMADGDIVFLENIQKHSDATISFTSWLSEANEVPEPGMLALIAVGVLAVVHVTKKRKQS
jgi:hypothetical protein